MLLRICGKLNVTMSVICISGGVAAAVYSVLYRLLFCSVVSFRLFSLVLLAILFCLFVVY
jgi:hypothetical protein